MEGDLEMVLRGDIALYNKWKHEVGDELRADNLASSLQWTTYYDF